jgi:glycosyltransferase involved in cell wall biosynthesis
VVPAQRAFYQALRAQGVLVQFAVYDLLCVLLPQHFNTNAAEGFRQWLEVVIESDGAICISETVANELSDWIKANRPSRLRPFDINWFHLGADVDSSAPTKGLPVNAQTILEGIGSRSSFLMVGTIEPRKAHAQVLQAFEQLWQAGHDVNLVIVGKQGWLVDNLIKQLRSHPELNNRLFWLDGISDEYLEKVYAASTCLIAASYGEGFGLPLIEAAQHKLPIMARDIPVFREVAGAHAWYFNAGNGTELANAVKDWRACHEEKQVPLSENISFLTWEQSAMRLMQLCTRANHRSPQLIHSMESSDLLIRPDGVLSSVRAELVEALRQAQGERFILYRAESIDD